MNQVSSGSTARMSLLLAVLAAACLPAAAQADRNAEETFAYTRAGTLGLGAGAGYRFSEQFAVRAGLNARSTEGGSRRIDDLYYERDRKTRHSAEVLADWFPFPASGFRVSTGLMATNTRTELTARPNAADEYVINGNAYAVADVGDLTASVRPRALSPYLGIGWESQRLGKAGVRLVVDAGAMHLQGKRVTLASSNAFDDPTFLNDLAAEEGRIRKVNDVAFGVSVGVGFSF